MRNLCCPQCGHKDLQVVNETDVKTTGKNYSAGQGCLGYMLFGPLGLLCGNCGQGQKTTTTNTTYWMCPKCGKKFENPNDMIKKIETNKKSAIVVLVMDIIVTLILVIMGFAVLDDTNSPALLIMGVIYCFIMALVYFAVNYSTKKMQSELDELERNMQKYQSYDI